MDVDDFFESLLGTMTDRSFSLDLDYLGAPSLELQHIDEVFTEDEVWTEIRGMPLDKCLGLDCFSALFFVSF
jgi:hypothetical protein